ncbi:hypothetical protein K5Q02_14105 [Pseudomonas sp. MM211]|uniref:hypothetical protein n=1 Tax=Pseudomonas sp. MM211 TaxID=2866808 RepID=UPI001CECFDB8|nr:hypothetical protein [Pseudomonas sp. MM211]UCJ15005.1 hypothetical protein K5Q02_14105 [Pseudomonas sp. MM211]
MAEGFPYSLALLRRKIFLSALTVMHYGGLQNGCATIKLICSPFEQEPSLAGLQNKAGTGMTAIQEKYA